MNPRVRGRAHFGRKPLVALAPRFGVQPEANWYGFTFNGKNILFRYGKPERPRPKYRYDDRPIFHFPFGDSAAQRRGKHFVLLQAKVPRSEYFFLIPTSAAEALAADYAKRTLRLTTGKKSLAKEVTEKLQRYKYLSLEDVKRALQ